MKPKPDDADAPKTLHEMQRRKMGQDDDAEIGAAIPQQPATSPWAHDLVPDEPLINREEDK